jgi:hypothetical protein
MNLTECCKRIKAHIERGERDREKNDQHFVSAGQLLKQLKDTRTGAQWEKIIREKCSLGRSRANELIAISDGRKSVADVRLAGAQRSAKHAAANRAVRRSAVANGKNKASTALVAAEGGGSTALVKADPDAAPDPIDAVIARVQSVATELTAKQGRAWLKAELQRIVDDMEDADARTPEVQGPADDPDDDMPTQEEADASLQKTCYDYVYLTVSREMSGATRQKFFARLKRKYGDDLSQTEAQRKHKGLPA